jgi:RHS repeat-associated protein
LGSTSYVTDASGEVYQHLEYFAFGETFVEEHNNTDRTPFLYSGKELDEETGLYYYGARYYDPKTSIWQSIDPEADKFPGWSPYNFNFNNPVNFKDPDGKKPFPTSIVKAIRDEIGMNALKRSVSIWLPEDVTWGENCIEVFNRIVQNVLFDKEQSVGSQIIGKNSTQSKLADKNRASGVMTFNFLTEKGKAATGNSTADKLSESVGDYIKRNYSSEDGGVKVYGLSVLDGYHSIMLTYGKNEDGDLEFNVFDQGPFTNMFDGNSTFTDPKDLDNAINEYVKGRQGKNK